MSVIHRTNLEKKNIFDFENCNWDKNFLLSNIKYGDCNKKSVKRDKIGQNHKILNIFNVEKLFTA